MGTVAQRMGMQMLVGMRLIAEDDAAILDADEIRAGGTQKI